MRELLGPISLIMLGVTITIGSLIMLAIVSGGC